MSDDPSELHYAQKPSRHRKTIRRVAILAVVLIGVALAMPLTMKELRRQRTLLLYDQCATGTSMLRAQAWRDLNAVLGSNINTSATLFLGLLRTPDGEGKFLVGVDLVSVHDNRLIVTRTRTIKRKGGPFNPPVYGPSTDGSVVLGNGFQLQVYSAKTDPRDPSHFTIGYTSETTSSGVIDGWLTNDGTVLLEPREATTTAPAPPSPGTSR